MKKKERVPEPFGIWLRAQCHREDVTGRIARDVIGWEKSLGRELYCFSARWDFIAFVRAVTGMSAIAFADAQATLYRPGDFLTAHDDTAAGKNRLAAYVLSMTPAWRADMGGILEFLDANGHVGGGYVPTFNALNLFRVPQVHCVSQVSLFGALRYSVTGWFRSH